MNVYVVLEWSVGGPVIFQVFKSREIARTYLSLNKISNVTIVEKEVISSIK